jgi:hypothetical protein
MVMGSSINSFRLGEAAPSRGAAPCRTIIGQAIVLRDFTDATSIRSMPGTQNNCEKH